MKLDSSATDTEDETPQGKKKKKDKAKHHKSKGKKDKKDNTKLLLKSKLKLLKPHKDKLKDLRKPELTPLIINRKVQQTYLVYCATNYRNTYYLLHLNVLFLIFVDLLLLRFSIYSSTLCLFWC